MSPNDLHIRQAHAQDAPHLQPLLKALEYPASVEQIEERLKTYETLGYGVLVAELNNKLAGLIALSFSELFISQKKRAHIEALIVDPQSKGQGIGRALLTSAEALATERGCDLIDLTSGIRRKPSGAHDFYTKMGYGNDGHWAKEYFRKKL